MKLREHVAWIFVKIFEKKKNNNNCAPITLIYDNNVAKWKRQKKNDTIVR